jgi:hypothetical protein
MLQAASKTRFASVTPVSLGLPSGSYFHSALFAVLIHSMAVGYFCASARIKFDDEQFAALVNELRMI